MDELIKEIEKKEQIARDILSIKAEIVGLDMKRNKNREASRALSKLPPKESKTWICSGNIFIKTKTDIAKAMISADQKSLDSTINELRDKIQERSKELSTMEGKEPISLSHKLKPLSSEERSALGQLLPTVTDVEFR